MRTTWKVIECAADNAPSYWIVTDKAWRGTVASKHDNFADALRTAEELNEDGTEPGDVA